MVLHFARLPAYHIPQSGRNEQTSACMLYAALRTDRHSFDHMAATLLYLVGPGGVFLNEQVIYLDGGNTLIQPATKN